MEAGLDSPALDARILLAHALGITATELTLRPEIPVGEAAEALAALAARRLAREPVSRILGEREFWGLPFRLSPATLVPRPDTETAVETALALLADRSEALRLLDLGTGSGCLLVALLHECPAAFGVGVDRSLEALATARSNAALNEVGDRAAFLAGDWGAALRGPFDLVVSNPPYIPTRDLAGLEPEVRAHDPRLALDGGPDGYDPYRIIFQQAAGPLLAPGGLLVVEIGIGQEADLSTLAQRAGLALVRNASDLSGIPRALAFRRQAGQEASQAP